MSEYWKSVPRKFCDFCKCWITDNKPSIEFHERGKRHKENVEQKLKEMRKRSIKESAEKEQTDEDMARMEKAALEAFKKDLKDNPTLAAQYGVSLETKPKPEPDTPDDSSSSEQSRKRKLSEGKKKKKEWYEATSPEGYSYYWSTVTGESTWTAPEEFVSIVEQAEEEEKKKTKVEDSNNTKSSSKEDVPDASTSISDPQPLAQPLVQDHRTGFGSWEVVREEKQPVLYEEDSAPPDLCDIPLPIAGGDINNQDPAALVPQKPKFKEKTVASLGTSQQSGPVSFKKRKVASGARNVRQRDNYD